MKPIGGYFELELTGNNSFPYNSGNLLNSGRNALEFIINNLPAIAKVYVPEYTCPVVLDTLSRIGIEYKTYEITPNLEIKTIPLLKDNEYIIANNYFGIKDNYIDQISQQLGDKLIIDNSQALFHTPKNGSIAFYSPRKYVGVPDGGIVYPKINDITIENDTSFDKIIHLIKRIDLGAEAGYEDFRENSEKLGETPVLGMSNFTRQYLRTIDWSKVQEIRQENFKILHQSLQHINLLNIPDLDTFACPMVYPIITKDVELRNKLISHKIFVAKYWPGLTDLHATTTNLVNHLIPLPIDQRYNLEDMERIIETIIS